MTKHRLMLSAAAAGLLATASSAVHAQPTEISTATSIPIFTGASTCTAGTCTSSAGNITIDASGSVTVLTASAAAVTINSNNSLINNGSISNADVNNGIGVQINTSAGNVFPPSAGFTSTGSINVGSNGVGKIGVDILGGNTFYGPVTLNTLNATALGGVTTTAQASSLIVQGDESVAFLLEQNTKITSNVLIGGGGISQNSGDNADTGSQIINLTGTVNGNFEIAAPLSGTGPSMVGIEELGGIHSCASDTSAPSGFSCPLYSGGSLVNLSTINLAGTLYPNYRGGNPESGSGIIIANSIDGGFLNSGPGTSSNFTTATIVSSGIVTSTITAPVVLVDPSRQITAASSSISGPLIIGPVTADIDPIDAGYSFINRGNIVARPIDPQYNTAALFIEGYSATYSTCLSSVAQSCSLTPQTTTQIVSGNAVTVDNVGGFLNTGTISASTITNIQTIPTTGPTTGVASATAMYVGAYATIPVVAVKAETISGSSTTAGSITAQVSGIGPGSAFAFTIAPNADVPELMVGQGGTIEASVTTQTVSPIPAIATAVSPFTLLSEAVQDQSGTLSLINNAGTIEAANTTLTPLSNAVTNDIQRAIDLSSGTQNNVLINNSGKILGDVLFGSTGNNHVLNVGDVGAAGAANPATGIANTTSNYAVLAESIISEVNGVAPATLPGVLNFGTGSGGQLNIGAFGYVNDSIYASPGGLNVTVSNNGTLFVANTATQGSMNVASFNINGGTLGLTISQDTSAAVPVVKASTEATIAPAAEVGLQFGTFISSGFTEASVANPTAQQIVLINAPVINMSASTLAADNSILAQQIPFLFQPNNTPLTLTPNTGTGQNLVLTLTPRVPGAGTATAPGLGLSGDAIAEYPNIVSALANDTQLGSAVATSLTVYNTPGQPASGINVAASQQEAQQVFSQFAPDVSGGTRAVAIMLTDEASGPVAARQRLLRSFADVPGEMTLWGEEFTGQINDQNEVSSNGTLTSFKDHGIGFSLGADAGSPRNGWYGGAFTFYSGDIDQLLPRDSVTNSQWYMLSGYTDWSGKHVFLDTQLSVAYAGLTGNRGMSVAGVVRDAVGKRSSEMAATGANTGVKLTYLGLEVDPHVSLDGLILREEGYSEAGGGDGMDLQLAPYYATSLRGAIGSDFKGSISLFGIDLTPEARAGYRYDLLQPAIKLKAAFESTGGLSTTGNDMTFTGPDPDRGNAILGLSLGASTDTWQLGVNYDWIRGNNGSTTQVGTITVLGRI